MAARLASSLLVAALIRRVEKEGGFAYVARRGSDVSGAVHVVFREPRLGTLKLFVPASQSMADNEILETASGGRLFMEAGHVTDDDGLEAFVASEARFDPDFWLLEIEDWRHPASQLLSIASE